MNSSISMELKNEVLCHSLALIESSTHPILIQLLDADHLWSLLQHSVNLIGRPEGEDLEISFKNMNIHEISFSK